MTFYTIYDSEGRFLGNLETLDLDNALLNIEPGQQLGEGQHGPETWFNGTEVALRPTVPTPTITGRRIVFDTPITGLTVEALDTNWGSIPLTPEPVPLGQHLWIEDQDNFVLIFDAPFPYLPLTLSQYWEGEVEPSGPEWVFLGIDEQAREDYLEAYRENAVFTVKERAKAIVTHYNETNPFGTIIAGALSAQAYSYFLDPAGDTNIEMYPTIEQGVPSIAPTRLEMVAHILYETIPTANLFNTQNELYHSTMRDLAQVEELHLIDTLVGNYLLATQWLLETDHG